MSNLDALSAATKQVVFIDSRAPDIQALIAGVQPGELVFVLDPASDGVQQIADILAANNLSNLASISIVGHGASGEIDLGATVLNDADLAVHAAALSTIGAALAPGGDLALYACNTAAGATGQQFIADLSQYAGGVDVAAATHLVGDTAHGGSWTLDAATGAIQASTPFTKAALASFEGELSSTTITGQLWFGGSNNGDGVASDNQIGYVNWDGSTTGTPTRAAADSHETGTSGTPSAFYYASVGLDTVEGLYFGIGSNSNSSGTAGSGTLDVGRIGTTDSVLQSLNLNPTDYAIFAVAVDPVNHVLYIGVWGDGDADTGIIKLSYNPNATDPSKIVNGGNSILSGSVIDPSYYVVTDTGAHNGGTGGAPFTNANAFSLDVTHQKLYFSAADFNASGTSYAGYPATNGIYVLDLATQKTQLLTSATQFPTTDNQHSISSVAVDTAHGIIYFETQSIGGGSTPPEIWRMPIAGGTATLMTLPSGVTLNAIPLSGGLAFDSVSQQLLVSAIGNGAVTATVQSVVYALQLNGAGTAFTSGAVVTQLDSANPYTAYTTGLTFDALATIGTLSGSSTEALQGGSGITLLAATPTGITDPDSGGFLASATVTISNAQAGDILGLDSNFSLSSTPSSVSIGGVNFLVSYDSTNHVLTIANPSGVEHTYAEYEAALTHVTFEDTGTDSSTGSHPTRTITWQVNDGAAGNPTNTGTGGNATTTTVTIDRAPTATADTNAVLAGASTTTASVLTNDTDKDGDTLTVIAVNGNGANVGNSIAGTYGHLTLGSNGSYTYTADNASAISSAPIGSHPVDTFTYTVSDGHGGTTTSTVSITIDRAPTVVADTAAAVESGSAATGSVLTNDADPDGDTITVSAVNGSGANVGNSLAGTYGHLTLGSNGNYSYTADNTSAIDAAATGSHLTDTFTYTASDGHGGTTSSTLTVTIDRPPTAVADTGTAVVGGPNTTGNVLTNDSDRDGAGDHLTVSGFTDGTVGTVGNVLHGTYGDITINSDGSYTFTAGATGGQQTAIAGAGPNPSEVITYTVSDGNGGSASSTLTIVIQTAPVISSVVATTPGGATDLNAGDVTITVNFSTAVSVTGTPSLTLSNGVQATYTGDTGSALTFVYSIQPGHDTADLQISSLLANGGTIRDGSGHDAILTLSGAQSDLHLQIDTTAPTVAVTADHTALLAGGTATVTFTFSEAVSSFVLGDTTVSGGALSNLVHVGINGSNQDIYTATFTPSAVNSEAGSVQVTASSYTDVAGNSGAASNTVSFTGDTLAPTVAVTADHTTLLAGQTATMTFTFSEAVASFALGDTTVSGGALSNLVHVGINGSGQDVYTATFTPNASNTEAGSIQVNAASYTDVAGNAGAASNSVSVTGDTLAPTVAVTADHTTLLAGQTATMTFTFSEAVASFVLGDTTVSGGALNNLVHVGVNGSGQDIYTATFTPNASNTEAGLIQVNAASYTDLAGNAGSASNTVSVAGDTLAPTVSIAANHTALLAGQTATMTFTFSEAVASFALGDTTVSGGALSNLVHVGVNGSGQDIYTATFTPNASNTEAGSIQVNAASYTDVAGNAGSASNTVSFTGDTLAPIVSIAANHTTLLAGQSATMTFTFSEAVASFALGDTTVSGGVLSNLVHVGLNGSGQDIYTATFTPNVSNTEAGSVQVNAASYADVAGNAGSASNTVSFTGDTLPPTVSIAANHTALLAGQTATMTFTFSEAVASFVLGDTTVSGGALSNLVHVGVNGSGQDIYTATFTPNASNTEAGSVQVNAASYTDVAGNAGSASNTVSFTGDTLAPVLSVAAATPSSGLETLGQTVHMTLTFSEAVTAGGTTTLALNDGGTATYDAAATAALHDPTKLVFDYTVGAGDSSTSALAITGVAHGSITDLAGNTATGVSATFSGLGVQASLVTANPDSNRDIAGQTITVDAAHGVLANDTDTNPADHLVVSAVNGSAAAVDHTIAGAYGSLTLHADGSYSYAANASANGFDVDTFTYTASNGYSPTSTSTLSVSVVGNNYAYVQVPSGGTGTGVYGNSVLDGSAGQATLNATFNLQGTQVLVGGPGDTLNAASYGRETFVFAGNFGHNTVNNFQTSLDAIQLQQSQFGSISNVMADLHQVGADSVLTLDPSHVVTITHTQVASLTAANFHLV